MTTIFSVLLITMLIKKHRVQSIQSQQNGGDENARMKNTAPENPGRKRYEQTFHFQFTMREL